MEIPAKIRRYLRKIEIDYGIETQYSFEELLLALVRRSTKVRDDPYRLLEQMREGFYRHLTEDQWIVFRVKLLELGGFNALASFRRLKRNSPMEYAFLLSVACRQEWLDAKINWKYNRDELWRPLLGAVACNDNLCFDRLCDLWETRFEESNNLVYEAITIAVIALRNLDRENLENAAKLLRKRKCYPYVGAVKSVLLGVQANSPEEVQAGFEVMFKKHKSYMFDTAEDAIIEPFALGLFELIRVYSPELLSLFDFNRELPWDADYATWRISGPAVEDEYRKLNLPSYLVRPLVEMTDMDWAPDNRPKRNPG